MEIEHLKSTEAEQYILNACCSNQYAEVLAMLPSGFSDMLNRPDHKIIYNAILNLVKQGTPPEVPNVVEEVCKAHSVGAVDLLVLSKNPFQMPTFGAENIKYNIERIRNCYINRQVLSICQCATTAINNGLEPAEYMQNMIRDMGTLVNSEQQEHTQEIKKMLPAYAERWLHGETNTGSIDLGYPKTFGRITGGMRKGQLMIVAGRPGMGKSLVMLNIALKTAGQGKRVIYFDLEMGEDDFSQRMLSALGHIDNRFFKLHKKYLENLPQDTVCKILGNIEKAENAIEKMDIVRHETRMNVEQITSLIRADNIKKPIDLVIIDHVGYIAKSSPRETKIDTISEATKALKAISKEIGVPVIIGSQINREGAKTDRPTLENLKDSGTLEEDADIVALLYRPYYYSKSQQDINILEVDFAKVRSNAPGICTLRVDMGYQLMTDGYIGKPKGAFESEKLDKKSPEAREAKDLFRKGQGEK